MKEYDFFSMVALLRSFFYLWITVESFFLGYLYWNAYRKYKSSKVIKAVEYLLFSIGLNFFYLTIIAIVGSVDRKSLLYDFLVGLIPFFSFPLVYSVRLFREGSTESLQNDEKKLEIHYKLKK